MAEVVVGRGQKAYVSSGLRDFAPFARKLLPSSNLNRDRIGTQLLLLQKG